MTTQAEELEVLESIYGDDPCFEKLSDKKFQYRFGEEDTFKSFIIEIEWTDDYPIKSPIINLNVFYNQHICQNFKIVLNEKLLNIVLQEIENPVTYTLIEHVRENLDEYLKLITVETRTETIKLKEENIEEKKLKVKKEQLTKSQKRRYQNRLGENGEIPRGSDWVSVLRHLQQAGSSCC